MDTFQTNKPYELSDLAKQLFPTVVFVATLYLVVFIWFRAHMDTFSAIIPILILLLDAFNKAARKRLQQLSFDNEKGAIVLATRSLLSGTGYRTIPFDTAGIELVASRSKLKNIEPLVLYVVERNKTVLEIKPSKDNISPQTLEEITTAAGRYPIKVTHK